MKKIVLSLAFILLAGIIFGQTLSKGNVLAVHVLSEFELQPGVTMEQFEEFFLGSEMWEEFNNSFEDIKGFPLKGIRGENAEILGIVYYMESDDVRNKYWAEEGVFNDTEAGQAMSEMNQVLLQELSKYINLTETYYTDWEIK